MKPNTERALWVGGAALGAAGIVTAVVLATRKTTPAVVPTPVQPTTTLLTQGHWYTASFTCPSTITPAITGIVGVNVVGGAASSNGGTVVFDYSGPTGSYPITLSGCVVSVVDNGPTPAPVASGGGSGGSGGGTQLQPSGGSQVLQAPALPSAAQGAYMELTSPPTIINGTTYLMSVPPVPGATFAQLVAKFAANIPAATVIWQDSSGALPTGWPSDTQTNTWRLAFTYGFAGKAQKPKPPLPLPGLVPGTRIWSVS